MAAVRYAAAKAITDMHTYEYGNNYEKKTKTKPKQEKQSLLGFAHTNKPTHSQHTHTKREA